MSLDKILDFKSFMDKRYGKKNNPIESNPKEIKVERFPTGSLKLDNALKGGYAKGTVTEIYGQTGSGKTSLCINAVAQHQLKYPNEPIMWVDLEKVFDPVYFENIGVDISPDKFILLNNLSKGEDIWEAIIAFIKINECGLVILDSVAGLLPAKEDEGDVEDSQMMLAAKLNSKGFRKLMPYISFGKASFIAINQIRSSIGGYGDPTTTPGGAAWEFYARTRIKTTTSKGEEGINSKHKFKLIKANYGLKDTVVETTIEYGKGFNYTKELVDIAVEKDIINKAGSWFSYDGTNIAQGLDGTVDALNDNPELKEMIQNQINEQLEI